MRKGFLHSLKLTFTVLKMKSNLFFCPAYLHDEKSFEFSKPCWGTLVEDHDVYKCEECESEYPKRIDWPLPVIIPDYDRLINSSKKKEEFERFEYQNFNQLKKINPDIYERLKEIPIPKFKKRFTESYKSEWHQYRKEVTRKTGLDFNFFYKKNGEGNVSIKPANTSHVYEPVIEIDNFKEFLGTYKRLGGRSDIMSEYVQACIYHELGHLAPPSTGCTEVLFCETDCSQTHHKIDIHRIKTLISWDESSANLNALAYYPDYKSQIQFIALSVYADSGLLDDTDHLMNAYNTEVDSENCHIYHEGLISYIAHQN
jgi:hypothetical protein